MTLLKIFNLLKIKEILFGIELDVPGGMDRLSGYMLTGHLPITVVVHISKRRGQ